MANLQSLKKRLKSIKSTQEMAEAMRTVSTVKLAKVSKAQNEFEDYSQACLEALEIIGDNGFPRNCSEISSRNCYVLLSSNRGFCGGFNNELLRRFQKEISEENETPLIIAFGRKASKFCTEKGIEAEFREMNDVPAYEEAEALTKELLEMYLSGNVNTIFIVSQNYINMMSQKPAKWKILPHAQLTGQMNADVAPLYLPNRETVGNNPALYSLVGRIYKIMLSHASALHAATLVAMRNACDNAEESSAKLETMINRIRQAEVTNSVIETSSGMAMRYMEN